VRRCRVRAPTAAALLTPSGAGVGVNSDPGDCAALGALVELALSHGAIVIMASAWRNEATMAQFLAHVDGSRLTKAAAPVSEWPVRCLHMIENVIADNVQIYVIR